MKRPKLKTKLAVIYIMLMAAVIIAVPLGTFAWLKSNRNVQAEGLPYKLDGSKGLAIQDIQYYKRDGKEGARNVPKTSRIDMTEYDMYFTDRNVDTPIVIRVAIDANPTSNTVKWSVKCPEKEYSWKDENGYLKAFYSNVSTIKFMKANKEVERYFHPEDPNIEADKLYETVRTHMEKIEGSSFATESELGEHLEKTCELEGKIQFDTGDISSGTLVLYIELLYNPIQVNAFMEDFEKQAKTDKEKDKQEAVYMENDISLIKFEYTKDETE